MMKWLDSLGDRATGLLLSLPWLAMAAIGVFWLSGFEVTSESLQYGIVKCVYAVMITWVADRSLFWNSPPHKHVRNGDFAPQLRRAGIFIGVCHLLQMV